MTVDSGSSVVTTPKTTRQQDVSRLPLLTTGNCPWIFKLNEDLGTISSGCTASTRKSSSKLKEKKPKRTTLLARKKQQLYHETKFSETLTIHYYKKSKFHIHPLPPELFIKIKMGPSGKN